MAIITRIIGGLGNQMFQYAIGRSLAIAAGVELKLDLSEMEDYKLRQFALKQFNIDAMIARADELPGKPRKGVAAKLHSLFTGHSSKIKMVVERGLAFDSSVMDLREPVYLSGYWQSEKYFLPVADTIRSEFSLRRPPGTSRQRLLAQIMDAARPVSIHVRRGDYVTNPKANAIHGTCEPDWYRMAIDRMVDRYGSPVFFVFSDDPDWARSNLQSSHPMIFIEPEADGRDGEDMHLMAACRAHIIANSSFSWWGAWLNPRPDKHVIAPRNWFRSSEMDDRDIVPAAWERL